MGRAVVARRQTANPSFSQGLASPTTKVTNMKKPYEREDREQERRDRNQRKNKWVARCVFVAVFVFWPTSAPDIALAVLAAIAVGPSL
jgi:hypothetical protein